MGLQKCGDNVRSLTESDVIKRIEDLKKEAEAKSDKKERAYYYDRIIKMYELLAERQVERSQKIESLENAKSYYFKCLEISREVDDEEVVLRIYNNYFGNVFQILHLERWNCLESEIRNKLFKIAQLAEWIIELLPKNNREDVVALRDNLATIYEEIGKSFEIDRESGSALEYYEMAMNELETAYSLAYCLRLEYSKEKTHLEQKYREICDEINFSQREIDRRIEGVRLCRQSYSLSLDRD